MVADGRFMVTEARVTLGPGAGPVVAEGGSVGFGTCPFVVEGGPRGRRWRIHMSLPGISRPRGLWLIQFHVVCHDSSGVASVTGG